MRFGFCGVAIGCLIFALVGCSGQITTKVAQSKREASTFEENRDTGVTAPPGGIKAADSTPASIALNRKIIYNTHIGMVVDEYSQFESELQTLVNANGGFVASNKTNRRYNNNQSGDWVVKVPVAQYGSFMSGVESIGFAETRTENAQDVTEEYVDIEARIKNKKALESRVLGILEGRSGKLDDILQIERELSRVREEIERMEGRLRYLKERTSLATISIHCREEQEYMPAAAPTLASRLWLALTGSMGTMGNFVSNLLVLLFAMLPWLVALALAMWVYNEVTGQRIHRQFLNRFRMLIRG